MEGAPKVIPANATIGRIYKLIIVVRDKPLPDVTCETIHTYIGSTTQKLAQRLAGHRAAALTGTSQLYATMRIASEVSIIQLESGIYGSAAALHAREELARTVHLPDLNSKKCARTEEERKEYHKRKSAEYYQKNRESILPGARERSRKRYHEMKQLAAAAPVPPASA